MSNQEYLKGKVRNLKSRYFQIRNILQAIVGNFKIGNNQCKNILKAIVRNLKLKQLKQELAEGKCYGPKEEGT